MTGLQKQGFVHPADITSSAGTLPTPHPYGYPREWLSDAEILTHCIASILRREQHIVVAIAEYIVRPVNVRPRVGVLCTPKGIHEAAPHFFEIEIIVQRSEAVVAARPTVDKNHGIRTIARGGLCQSNL